MKTVEIQSLTAEELKTLISETVKEELKKHSIEEQRTEYLTRKQVSKMLKVSHTTIWNWEKRGIIKRYRVGVNKIRYKKEDVENSIKPL